MGRNPAAAHGWFLRIFDDAPTIKQALASQQMKSRYLEYLITRFMG